jgi:hypothetical protein
MEVNLLDDELAFLVLLTALVGLVVRPTHESFASLTKKVRNTVQARYEQPVFRRTEINVHALIK